MLKNILVINILVFSTALYGVQNTPIGFINGFVKIKGYSSPNNNPIKKIDLTLYDAPGGNSIGSLPLVCNRVNADGFHPGCSANLFFVIRGNKVDVDQRDLISRRYKYQPDYNYPKYYDTDSSWLNLFVESYEEGVWIKTDNYKITTTTFLKDIVQHELYELYGYDNYRLRKAPFIDDNIIITLNTRKHVLKNFTGNVAGSWAEAIIYEIKEAPDVCFNEESLDLVWTGQKWTGWIKVVDDNGFPNDIRYYWSC